MSIHPISSSYSSIAAAQWAAQSRFKRMRDHLDSLSSALSAQDAAAAKNALTQFVSEMPGIEVHAPKEMVDALNKVQQSLDTGNLSAAKSAFAGMIQSMKQSTPPMQGEKAPGSDITGVGGNLNIAA